MRQVKMVPLLIALVAATLPVVLWGDEPTVKRSPPTTYNLAGNGGFENVETSRPWGTGLHSEGKKVWWTSGNCDCWAIQDQAVHKSGRFSMKIHNQSSRAPQVYGTTAQRIAITPNRSYQITLWAKASGAASNGAVVIAVDDEWKVRPIELPGGTYSWRKFTATFSLPADHADLRIISQDRGIVWIDDVEMVPLQGVFSQP